VDPKTGEVKEYPLKTARTGPHRLVEDKQGKYLVQGERPSDRRKLDPKSGAVTEYKMPDRKATDPYSLAFDQSGICGLRCSDPT
jgi:virginiamycin B lyase